MATATPSSRSRTRTRYLSFSRSNSGWASRRPNGDPGDGVGERQGGKCASVGTDGVEVERYRHRPERTERDREGHADAPHRAQVLAAIVAGPQELADRDRPPKSETEEHERHNEQWQARCCPRRQDQQKAGR